MTDADGAASPVGAPSPAAARLVATSFLALFAIVGLALYGLPYYYDFFVRELGWSRAFVTSGNALGKLVVGPACGFLVGWTVDRIGPKRPMIVGIVLAGVALAGLGQVHGVTVFYFLYILNAAAYVTAGPLPNQVLLSRRFERGRGRAMGIAYLGIGVGLVVVPHLSRVLVDAFGWRSALAALGGIVVLAAMPLVLTLPASAYAATARGEPAASVRGVLRTRSFHLLALGSMASVGAVGGASQHLKLLLAVDQNRTQAEAATVLTVIGLASLVGRVGAGWLADRIGPRRVMLLVSILVGSSMLVLLSAPAGTSIFAFAVTFGLGLGGEYLVIPLVAAELFGTQLLGRVMGIVLTADGVAEAALPVLVGHLRDRTGAYTAGFALLAVLAFASAVAVLALPRTTDPRGPGS